MKIWNMGVSETSDHIQIKIKVPNPSQKPPASSKAPFQDLKDMDVLCNLKIKIESQYLNRGYTKEQWTYQNQDPDDKSQSGTSSILQNPKSGLKGHGCSLQLKKQHRKTKFRTRVYQRPVTISESETRCQTPVRNLQHPPKPQMRT